MNKEKCCSGMAVELKGCSKSNNSSLDEPAEKKTLIEFMFIDLTTCDRCIGTDASLDEAIGEASLFLRNIGYNVEVRKTLVEDEQQAEALGFISSPTIRINGRDIQLDIKESRCSCCGEIAGQDIDCRVWIWQGREYTAPPKAMIIDAILRNIYGAKRTMVLPQRPKQVPDNLKRFFAAVSKQKQ
ncbi:MAG: DUF2703 domain-containing protein [Veillonellaceae bacterium]|nr:DUF2703 domain-containing protein [Veillonellaceae bacterium]